MNDKKVYREAEIYLWDYRDKIVISDFDGTITKSNFRG
jgi:phosphatidate phosphatase PAH1